MKLSEWARRNGVHYQTAYRWFRSGTLPVPARKLATGTILVEVPAVPQAAGAVALYARVSAHD
jgi:putative resolvase